MSISVSSVAADGVRQAERLHPPAIHVAGTQHGHDVDVHAQAFGAPVLPLVACGDLLGLQGQWRKQAPAQISADGDRDAGLFLDELLELRLDAVGILYPVEDETAAEEHDPQQDQENAFDHVVLP